MNTQHGIQQVFPWVNGFQTPLTSLLPADPLPDWDSRSSEPHPEVIGLTVKAVYPKAKP